MSTTQLIYGSLSANTLGSILLSSTTVNATTYLNLPILNGSIGEVHMYNRRLTDEEILYNFNAVKWWYGI
jgi:hypothetical protein